MLFDLKDTKGDEAGKCTYRSRMEIVVSRNIVVFGVWEISTLTCDRYHSVEDREAKGNFISFIELCQVEDHPR